MTIPKAIEILKDILKYVEPGDPPEEHDAIKLGIGALKDIKYFRNTHIAGHIPLLPGETAD